MSKVLVDLNEGEQLIAVRVPDGCTIKNIAFSAQYAGWNTEQFRRIDAPQEAGPRWNTFPDVKPQKTGWYCVMVSDPDDIGWDTKCFWRSYWTGSLFSSCEAVEDGQPVVSWIDPVNLTTEQPAELSDDDLIAIYEAVPRPYGTSRSTILAFARALLARKGN